MKVSDPNLWLYSPSTKYEPDYCELEEEYGGCSIDLRSNDLFYLCMVPKYSIRVHLKCDKTIKGTPKIESLMCPKCKDIDPETSKKRAKLPSGRGRGRPRNNYLKYIIGSNFLI